MGFDKRIPTKIDSYKIFDVDNEEELQKVANISLPAGFEYDPDYLYLLVRIVSSGEYYGSNKNGDYFPTSELERGYETFADAHPFQEHRNKDVANALGKIISFEWNPVMKTVEVLKAIDRKKAPSIVRGYEKGYMTDVSMGCRVPYTVCSICGNKASKRSEFCDHVKLYRNKYLPNGEKVFEINYKPKFHDSSLVLSGAERSAKAVFVLEESDFDNPDIFEKKASHGGKVYEFTRLSEPELQKIASDTLPNVHPLLQRGSLVKEASYSTDLQEKLAAIEKELTGKVLGVATKSEEYTKPVDKFIELIRFMGEGRLNDSTENISDTLRNLADANGVSYRKAFKAFLSVAELMGITLYPTELIEIAKGLSFGENPEFDLSSRPQPMHYDKFLNGSNNLVLKRVDELPKLDDPSKLLTLFEEAPLYKDVIQENPAMFIRIVNKTEPEDDALPSGFTEVIKRMLKPIIPNRSSKAPNIHGRILSYLSNGSVLADPTPMAFVDNSVMLSPRNLGDLLGNILYTNYQSLRPDIKDSGMAKTAAFFDDELNIKTASKLGEICEKPLFFKEASFRPMDLTDKSDFYKLLKIAKPIDAGNYNAFNEEFMEKFSNYVGDGGKAEAIKLAGLLDQAGEEKLATAIKNDYSLPDFIIEDFFKLAYDNTKEELTKAANDLSYVLIADNFSTDDLVKEASAVETELKDTLTFAKIEKYFE